MSTVDDLMHQAFGRPRDPRSDEYKAGCRDLLNYKIHGTPLTRPYPMGTAQADAYYAGTDEGHDVYKRHQERSAARSSSNG
jgi:hypothetical protein